VSRNILTNLMLALAIGLLMHAAIDLTAYLAVMPRLFMVPP